MITYNVVVVGLGSHAINRIIPTLVNMNQLKLFGVCSRNNDIVKESAKKWDCFGWTNYKEMLKVPEIDVIYIATPIGLHFSYSEKALNAGKHVWCEKPLTSSYKKTDALMKLAEKNDRLILESFMYLYHPQFKMVKKFIDDNKKLNSIICRFPTFSCNW